LRIGGSRGSGCHGPNLRRAVIRGGGFYSRQLLDQGLQFLDGLTLRGDLAAQLIDLSLGGRDRSRSSG